MILKRTASTSSLLLFSPSPEKRKINQNFIQIKGVISLFWVLFLSINQNDKKKERERNENKEKWSKSRRETWLSIYVSSCMNICRLQRVAVIRGKGELFGYMVRFNCFSSCCSLESIEITEKSINMANKWGED